MSDNDQPFELPTKLYNAVLEATTPPPCDRLRRLIYTCPSILPNPTLIRRALEDGSLQKQRNIGPKSIALIKRWLEDHPPTEPTLPANQTDNTAYNPNPTIHDIMQSLAGRGFLREPNYFNAEAIQTQLDAIMEEVGEVARCLRRARQSHNQPDLDQLAVEAADVTIAATCLLATITGPNAPAFLAGKLENDDKRLWLHSGRTREQYEQRGNA